MRKRTIITAAVALFILAACKQMPFSNNSSPTRTAYASNGGSSSRSSGQLVSFADVVDQTSPAVVTIRSARRVRAPEQFPFAADPFFQKFFGIRPPGGAREAPSEVMHALGSGVIVRADGHILTNHHVIDGAEEIKVDLSDRRTFSAKLVGSDAPSDLAVLKISAGNLPVLSPGDSDRVRVGDVCLALGNPLGIGQTVTAGIVSAKGRATGLSNGAFEDFLQTDAPINQGNSGGALVNTTGELIGINSAILSPTGGNIGIGFAIPSNMAKNVLGQLIGKGKVRRGFLGVSIQPVTSDIAASLGIKDVRGALVNSVSPGGPAERAGIRAGDVITAVDGTAVDDPNSFRNRIASTSPDTAVNLTIVRDGQERQVNAKLGELTPEAGKTERLAYEPDSAAGGPHLGIAVEPLTSELAAQLGLRKGTQGLVVREIDPAGPAAEAGIQAGDVIVEVNRQPVRAASDMAAALKRSGSKPALLLINRGGQNVYLTLQSH